MSSLDEKLLDIVREHVLVLADQRSGELTDEEFLEVANEVTPAYIEQIKQAFIDAGWVDVKKPITGDIHGVGIYKVSEKLFTINGVDELVAHDGTKVKFDPEQPVMMTGQEWYDRFEKEVNNIGDNTEISTAHGADGLPTAKQLSLEVAKKASGLTEQTLSKDEASDGDEENM